MNWSIRKKLLGAFSLDILLMLALGIFALSQMAIMNDKAALVTNRTIPSLNIGNKISFNINRYRTLQLEYLINTSPSDRERTEHEMLSLETQMLALFQQYDPLTGSDDQQQALDHVQSAWLAFTTANHEHFLPDAREANTGSVQPAFNRLNPLYQDLTNAADQLASQTQLQATHNLTIVEQTFERIRSFVITDTLLSMIFSALVSLLLAGALVRRIRRLTDATRPVADGDFSHGVEVIGHDEIATLANAFNQMVARLAEQRQLLEQRTEAEREAVRARATAEAASQMKSRFLATMSHELRTPLNAILGYAQVMQLEAKIKGQQDSIQKLQRIAIAGRHLLTIINNVLDFSKIEAGKMEIDLVPIAIDNLLEEAVAMVEPLAHEHGNRILISNRTDNALLISDPGKIRQILFNVLANAAKFTEQGEIELLAWIEINQQQPIVVFAVRDTGIGISPEQLGRLFQPFTQADASITRRYGGTGLGLTLSRELCDLLGGQLDVVSALGQGTTFSIRLPQEQSQQRHTSAAMANIAVLGIGAE